MTTGIILLAHGSRDPVWRGPIEAVALQIVLRQPTTPVLCAYLELCGPTLAEAAEQLVGAGAKRLKVFPVFFGVGKHAREDIPKLLKQVQATHPDIHLELLPAAGESIQLTGLLAEIALSD
ncbi:MAG: CbiX/SirB N-terminal domain-containing protein [Pseudomonadota bacterium]